MAIGDDFLATYGPWNLDAFLGLEPERTMRVAVLCVRTDQRDASGREAVGREVRRLWDDMRMRLPTAHGHRLGWSDVVFLVDGLALDVLVETLRAASVAKESACVVWFAAAPVACRLEQRSSVIDELTMGITKIGHRNAYPYAWCGSNGRLLHRVDDGGPNERGPSSR